MKLPTARRGLQLHVAADSLLPTAACTLGTPAWVVCLLLSELV